jgi:hypothetical protein
MTNLARPETPIRTRCTENERRKPLTGSATS